MGNTRKKRAVCDSTVNPRMREAVADSLVHGKYDFAEDTMSFWNSRVVAGMFKNNTFVTSEDNYDRSKILYTARLYDWRTHSMETIGEFQQFSNVEEASQFAKSYKE